MRVLNRGAAKQADNAILGLPARRWKRKTAVINSVHRFTSVGVFCNAAYVNLATCFGKSAVGDEVSNAVPPSKNSEAQNGRLHIGNNSQAS